jgi:uncharacterized membrane protein YoaT (DUF817 family)
VCVCVCYYFLRTCRHLRIAIRRIPVCVCVCVRVCVCVCMYIYYNIHAYLHVVSGYIVVCGMFPHVDVCVQAGSNDCGDTGDR